MMCIEEIRDTIAALEARLHELKQGSWVGDERIYKEVILLESFIDNLNTRLRGE